MGTTPPFQRLVEVSFLPLFTYAYAYVVDSQQLPNANAAPRFGIIVRVETIP